METKKQNHITIYKGPNVELSGGIISYCGPVGNGVRVTAAHADSPLDRNSGMAEGDPVTNGVEESVFPTSDLVITHCSPGPTGDVLMAIRVRLYPNKTQEIELNKVLGCFRVVYNQMLELCGEYYKKHNELPSLTFLGNHLHKELLKNGKFPFLNEQNTKMLKQACRMVLASCTRSLKAFQAKSKAKKSEDQKNEDQKTEASPTDQPESGAAPKEESKLPKGFPGFWSKKRYEQTALFP